MRHAIFVASVLFALPAGALFAQDTVGPRSRLVLEGSLSLPREGFSWGEYREISARYEQVRSQRLVAWASAGVAAGGTLECFNPGFLGGGSGCAQGDYSFPLHLGLALRLSPERYGFVPYAGAGLGLRRRWDGYRLDRILQVGWDVYLTSRVSIRNEFEHGSVSATDGGEWAFVAGLAWWL